MIKNLIIIVLLLILAAGGYVATTTIDSLKGAMTALTIKHKKNILKTKVKERGKRLLAAIPIVGLLAIGWFEKQEYDEWKEGHPDGNFEEYKNEVVDATSDVAEEIVGDYCQDLGATCDLLKGSFQQNH